MTKKQFAFTIAKIGFALLVLTWLLHKVNAARVWHNVRNAEPLPVIAGVLLCWLTVLIAGVRWHRLLEVFGIGVPLRSLVCITQIGQFFLMFLPGPAGDDLTRMLYVSRLSKGHVGEACTSVLLDRCIGLASILFMALLCIPWQWQLLAVSQKTWWLGMAIASAGGAAFVAALLYFAVDGAVMQRLAEKGLRLLPASGIREELFRISSRIFNSKLAIAKVLGIAVGTQFILCALYWLAGRSVGIHAPMAIWLNIAPLLLAANAVPVTVAGIGVREYLLILFLGRLAHVESEQALAASFIAFSMMLANSVLGGIVYIFYRTRNEAGTTHQ
jgi:hypothetical protein